jgi:peptide/nickel transport system substrate-binding protein
MWPDDELPHLDRRQLLRLGVQGMGLASAAALFEGCGSNQGSKPKKGGGPPLTPGPSGDGTPKRGGTLTVGLVTGGPAETLNLQKASAEADYLRGIALFDGLYILANGGLQPGLAASAEPNADATVWTFNLRRDVHWHDGKPFTADDVLYTINTWNSPSKTYFTLAQSLIDFKGVRKRGPMTIEIPLKRAIAEFPSVVSIPQAYIIQDGTRDFSHPVGTGPFRFGSFKAGQTSTFTANQDYWRGAPYVDKLVVNSSFQEDAARLNAVASGGVSIAPVAPPALAKANASTGRMVIGNAPGAAMVPITLRVNQPPFNDPRVVQAFKLLTNRDAIVQNVWDGYATRGNDAPLRGLKYWADIEQPYDPEKAKSLLKAAGKADLTMPIEVSAVLTGMVELATAWAAQAAAVGVKVPVKTRPVSSYYTPAGGDLKDSRLLSVNLWANQPSLTAFYLTTLGRGAPFNETGWGLANPNQYRLMDQAMAELDEAKATEKWHAVQAEQIQQGGYLVPANNNSVDAYATNVRNGNTTKVGNNSLLDYHRIWLA